MILKAIIVDDEVLARKSLARLCQKSENINCLEAFDNGHACLEFLRHNKIDIIFLDIEMPGLTGIEMLEELIDPPQIIFTTSKIEYAYEAFEYEITDFLKKPIAPLRFEKAVQKAIANEEQFNAVALSSKKNELYIRTDGKLIRVPYSEIQYFENVGDYVKIISDRGTFVFNEALKNIAAKLQHPRFLKVHRSYIINLNKIKDIQDNSIVIEKKVIPISRAHKSTLIKSLNILN